MMSCIVQLIDCNSIDQGSILPQLHRRVVLFFIVTGGGYGAGVTLYCRRHSFVTIRVSFEVWSPSREQHYFRNGHLTTGWSMRCLYNSATRQHNFILQLY